MKTNGFAMNAEHMHTHHELMFNFSHIPIRHSISGHVYETNTPYIVYRAPFTLHSSNTLCSDTYIRYKLDINPYLFTVYDGIISMGNFHNVNEYIIPVTDEQLGTFRPLLDLLNEQYQTADSNLMNHTSIGLLAAIFGKVSDLSDKVLFKHISTQPYIQDVMYYIVNHISENLTVDNLSEIFFVSRTKLYSDFRLVTNLSLHEYITAVRISLAKTWLMEGVPVSELAERCGFTQASSFIVMFRRLTGMTPGEYRERTASSNRN
ncbi:MAG: helix-turn-helix transcriptional regulator [Clostridia bacterium]|nr:helix-turn-helix transcriptional regulator [Clostridia bacterium]